MVQTPLLTEFLARLGFESNPFRSTNADEEQLLSNYFVPPPYYDSVYGDPSEPTSCMVFAPRGAGKSAQRKMVEQTAPDDRVLCITYDSFRNPSGGPVSEMTLSDHLLNICRVIAMGLMTWIGERRAANRLDANEKEALRILALGLLSTATRADLRSSLNSLRNLSDRAKDLWNQHSWAVNAVVSSIGIAAGGGGGVLPLAPTYESAEDDPGEHVDLVCRLTRK